MLVVCSGKAPKVRHLKECMLTPHSRTVCLNMTLTDLAADFWLQS